MAKARGRRARPQVGRCIGYEVQRTDGHANQGAIQRLFERAVRDGVVIAGQFYNGRDTLIWWNGAPGPAMRTLRADIVRLATATTGISTP